MASWFYGLIITGIFIALYLAYNNITLATVIIDVYLMLFGDTVPANLMRAAYILNFLVWGRVLYNIFASRKTD